MKKSISLLFAIISLFAINFNSSAQSYKKGDKNFSAGVNLGYGLGANVGLDVGVHDAVSIGVIGAYSSRSYGYLLSSNYRVTYIGIGARAAFHFGKYLKEVGINEDKLDPYIGAVGGFRMVNYDDSYSTYYNGRAAGVLLGGYVGVRYYFKEKLGVYAEGGSPYSSAGITLKF